jgi:hypothetical protein
MDEYSYDINAMAAKRGNSINDDANPSGIGYIQASSPGKNEQSQVIIEDEREESLNTSHPRKMQVAGTVGDYQLPHNIHNIYNPTGNQGSFTGPMRSRRDNTQSQVNGKNILYS